MYKTPGVYVEEISKLPPSVAEVATAIPAFLGCTEKGPASQRISTLLEYEETFGGPQATDFTVTTVESEGVISVSNVTGAPEDGVPAFLMHYALAHYFQNGGGPCWIFSTGSYTDGVTSDGYENALGLLLKEDEPTLIVMPDAIKLEPADYYDVYNAALDQCAKLQDRFAIFDVRAGDVDAFRTGVSGEALRYGAAYHPYLQTSATFAYDEGATTIVIGEDEPASMASMKDTQTARYNLAKAALVKQRAVLPPSAAIAGVYARVDRDRGVWKAPANVAVKGVSEPILKITDETQKNLNVDATAGKSINAIRAFTGKGILVWGARTLAGNDNEWRYVPVRRLFNLIEESVKKSTGFAVFEPNDATTWLKVKGMIESYLFGLWERGALAGPTPESAFFVNVGLGQTMTAQDILEGRMNVEIGVAAVRPAEFIILRFSHKLQEA